MSRGEWAAARKAGVPNDRISLEGVGKTDADLDAAIRAVVDGEPLRWVAIESADEADALAVRALRAGLGRARRPPIDVLVRLNPDVNPETQAVLAVGAGRSKFGMTETELTATVERLAASGGAVASAAGSTSMSDRSWARSMPGATPSGAGWRCSVCCGAGCRTFDTLDVGGGFAVPPFGEPGPRPGAIRARAARPSSRRSPPTAARIASRSSPAGSSSPAPAGSSPGCSTSATAVGSRSSSTPG